MSTFVAKNKSHKVLGQAKRQSRAMSVRNPNYQQVHGLYELCSDGRSLQEICRMSGVSHQKYLEWERNQALGESQKKAFLKCLRNEESFESPVALLFIPLLAPMGAEARGERRSGRMADEGWLTETNQPFFVPLGVISSLRYGHRWK